MIIFQQEDNSVSYVYVGRMSLLYSAGRYRPEVQSLGLSSQDLACGREDYTPERSSVAVVGIDLVTGVEEEFYVDAKDY